MPLCKEGPAAINRSEGIFLDDPPIRTSFGRAKSESPSRGIDAGLSRNSGIISSESAPILGRSGACHGNNSSSVDAVDLRGDDLSSSVGVSGSLSCPSREIHLERLLLYLRRKHALEGAKALAILEVKDQLIARLEQELAAARKAAAACARQADRAAAHALAGASRQEVRGRALARSESCQRQKQDQVTIQGSSSPRLTASDGGRCSSREPRVSPVPAAPAETRAGQWMGSPPPEARAADEIRRLRLRCAASEQAARREASELRRVRLESEDSRRLRGRCGALEKLARREASELSVARSNMQQIEAKAAVARREAREVEAEMRCLRQESHLLRIKAQDGAVESEALRDAEQARVSFVAELRVVEARNSDVEAALEAARAFALSVRKSSSVDGLEEALDRHESFLSSDLQRSSASSRNVVSGDWKGRGGSELLSSEEEHRDLPSSDQTSQTSRHLRACSLNSHAAITSSSIVVDCDGEERIVGFTRGDRGEDVGDEEDKAHKYLTSLLHHQRLRRVGADVGREDACHEDDVPPEDLTSLLYHQRLRQAQQQRLERERQQQLLQHQQQCKLKQAQNERLQPFTASLHTLRSMPPPPDTYIRHVAAQTDALAPDLYAPDLLQLYRHETSEYKRKLDAATETQTVLLDRVESMIGLQRESMRGYRAAAFEVKELREARSHEDNKTLELEQAIQGSICSERTALDNLTVAMSIEATLQTALEEAQAAAEMEVRSEDEQHLKALRRAEEKTELLLSRETESYKRFRQATEELEEKADAITSTSREELVAEINEVRELKRALKDESEADVVFRAELRAAHRSARLAEERERRYNAELNYEAIMAGKLQDRRLALSEADASLEQLLVRVTEAEADLAAVSAQARCERAEAVLASTEAVAHGDLLKEVKLLEDAHNDLRRQLQLAEAGALWEELQRTEDREVWARERAELCEEGLSVARCHDLLEAEQNVQRLIGNERFEAERQELEHFERCSSEWRLEYSNASRSELMLARELAGTRGREAALLQELDRLSRAVLNNRAIVAPEGNDGGSGGNRNIAALGLDGNDSASSSGQSSLEGSLPNVAKEGKGRDSDRRQLRRHMRRVRAPDCSGVEQVDREVLRLRKALARERGQKEHFRTKGSQHEQELAKLRLRIQEAENQIKALRDEGDHRRALVAALQQRCAAAETAGREERLCASEGEEALRRLQLLQRDLQRKDAAISELRAKVRGEAAAMETEQRRIGEQRRKDLADAARIKAASREEFKTQEQLLSDSQAEVGRLRKRLCSFEASGSKATAVSESSVQGRHSFEPTPQTGVRLSAQILPSTTVPSLDASVLADSLNILNLRPEDLAQFLNEPPKRPCLLPT